jgi:hypothetical protein
MKAFIVFIAVFIAIIVSTEAFKKEALRIFSEETSSKSQKQHD